MNDKIDLLKSILKDNGLQAVALTAILGWVFYLDYEQRQQDALETELMFKQYEILREEAKGAWIQLKECQEQKTTLILELYKQQSK